MATDPPESDLPVPLSSTPTPASRLGIPSLAYGARNRREYLRVLLLRELWLDNEGPLQNWLSRLPSSVREEAVADAHRRRDEELVPYEVETKHRIILAAWTAQQRMGSEQGPLPQETREFYESRGQSLDDVPTTDLVTHAEFRKLLVSVSAQEFAEVVTPHLYDTYRSEHPNENQIAISLSRAIGALLGDSQALETETEELAYALGIHRLPHRWLTEALRDEAMRTIAEHLIAEIRPGAPGRPATPVDLKLPCPPWRRAEVQAPRDVEFSVEILTDDDREQALQKLKDAERRVKERRKRPGPGPTPPPDEDLIRLLYRHLRGASYSDLADTLSSDYVVHHKTLARYLRQARAIIFAPEE